MKEELGFELNLPSWTLPVLIVAVVSCAVLRPRGPDVPTTPDAQPCPQQQTVLDLIRDLETCEAALAGATKGLTSEHGDIKVRTRTRTVEGPAKRCGGEGPKLRPITTTECMPGLVCLDADAQRALALNLAAYETWVRKVQECEGTPR